MQIISQSTSVKCGAKGCNNLTSTYISVSGRTGKVYLCDKCLSQLVQYYLPKYTPKSPINTIKKILDSKEQQDG